MRAASIALVFGFCVAFVRAQSPASTPDVDSYLKGLEEKGFSGVVLLEKDGKPVVRRGIGLADRAKRTAASPETGFDIGSITKGFTSAAIFRLEQDGKLRLDDPLSKFFKNVPADKAAITLRQLVTHRSGMADLVGADGTIVNDYTTDYDFEPVTRDEIVKRALASRLLFTPGSDERYSNTGYSILAAVIEIASHQSYESYVYAKIFKPSGMNRTGYLRPQWKKQNLAVGYVGDTLWRTPLDHAWLIDGPSWNLRGNGGMLSTVDDISKWTKALEHGRILNAREREAYFAAMNVKKNKRGVVTMGAAGGNDVFTSVYLWVLDEHRLVVIFSNNGRFHAERYAGDLSGIMLRTGH